MTLLTRLRSNGIAWTDGFVSAERCTRLRAELEYAFWWPSTVVNRGRTGEIIDFESQVRQSETTTQEWFTDEALAELACIERRLCDLLELCPQRFEPWQATRYQRGGRFERHHDAGLFRDDAAGERATTLLLYLDAPERGGATRFPELGIEVSPQAGRLVVWNNLDHRGRVNQAMAHEASPVSAGLKTTLTSWCREHTIRLRS